MVTAMEESRPVFCAASSGQIMAEAEVLNIDEVKKVSSKIGTGRPPWAPGPRVLEAQGPRARVLEAQGP